MPEFEAHKNKLNESIKNPFLQGESALKVGARRTQSQVEYNVEINQKIENLIGLSAGSKEYNEGIESLARALMRNPKLGSEYIDRRSVDQRTQLEDIGKPSEMEQKIAADLPDFIKEAKLMVAEKIQQKEKEKRRLKD